MDLKLGLCVPKKTYRRENWALKLDFKGMYRRFSWFYHCGCAETPLILLPISKWTSNSNSSHRKIYKHAEIGPKNCILRAFSPLFVILSLRMRRNTINSTSGFKMDVKFWLIVPKNIYTRVNWVLKLHFKAMFRCCSQFCHCACAERPLVLLPVSKWTSNSDSSYRKPYTHAEIGH